MQDLPPPPTPTVLIGAAAHELPSARPRGEQLWILEADVQAVTGFEWKPEGLCVEERCVPVPADAAWAREHSEEGASSRWLELTGFAEHIGQAWASEPALGAWSFATAPLVREAGLGAGLAPDFTLEDAAGESVRLSELRGSKVLLLTWASW